MKRRIPLSWAAFDQSTCRKVVGGTAVLTTGGLIMYEKRKINKILSQLIDTNVLDIDKKRPDYIYIKYHIYKESLRMQEMEQDNNWINIIINPFSKWWRAFKHSVAWRLLNIAQNGDHHERLKAVRQLAYIDHLKDWDFRHLAQMCDARTAVSLARSDCDTRWFVPVYKSGLVKNPKLVLTDLKTLFMNLSPTPCSNYFLKKYFEVPNLADVEHDEFPVKTLPISQSDMDLLKQSIMFLHHITKDVKSCKEVINLGGLVTLMELKKLFDKDNETLATLCKCMANISLVDGCLDHFFMTGWVGVLAEWTHHPDVRLQVIASKVLANLDFDDPYYFSYPPNVYPLYPRTRQRVEPKLDAVFIHGLLGGVFYTWRQRDRQEPNELGLYGKNAFYTSESNDVFLVDEIKRNGGDNGKPVKKSDYFTKKSQDAASNKGESINPVVTPVINRKAKRKALQISDVATKELVETLQMSGELDREWEVVYPDCPLKASENADGQYSIPGNSWINDDMSEEYTNCWPMDWLPEDYPNIRILGIDYTSTVTQWSSHYTKHCPCEKKFAYLETKSEYLLDNISKAGVGRDRPIVWIGHSMGGILCKSMILKALDYYEPNVRKIAANTKGIIFLGTPHKGSSIARWKQHMQVILSPSIEVKELEENSPKLLELHKRFMEFLHSYYKNINIVSIAEGEPTKLTSFKFPLHIVTEDSANIGHGDFYVLKDDHLSLSKPIFRQSFLYQKLLNVIGKCMNAPLEYYDLDNINWESKSSSKTWSYWDYTPWYLFKYLKWYST